MSDDESNRETVSRQIVALIEELEEQQGISMQYAMEVVCWLAGAYAQGGDSCLLAEFNSGAQSVRQALIEKNLLN